MNIILPKITLKIERWKWNKEFQIYVSTLGNFKDKNKNNIKIKINNSGGYCIINTIYGWKAAHRLVLSTFKPINNMEDLTVDHLNHNKRDNSLSNLEWVSKDENQKRANNDLIIEDFNIKGFVVSIGKQDFKSLDQAIEWIIYKNHKNSQIKIEKRKIKNKIINAIKTNKKYSNEYWKLKEGI